MGGLRPCWSTSWMSRSVGDSMACKDSVFTEKPLSTLARQQSGSNEGKQDQAAVQRLLGKTIGTNQAKAKPGHTSQQNGVSRYKAGHRHTCNIAKDKAFYHEFKCSIQEEAPQIQFSQQFFTQLFSLQSDPVVHSCTITQLCLNTGS